MTTNQLVGQVDVDLTNIGGFNNARPLRAIWLNEDQLLIFRSDGTIALHSGQSFFCQWRLRLPNVLSVISIPEDDLVLIESLDGIPFGDQKLSDIPELHDRISFRVIEKKSGLVVLCNDSLSLSDDITLCSVSGYYLKMLDCLKKEYSQPLGRDALIKFEEVVRACFEGCELTMEHYRLRSDARLDPITSARINWDQAVIVYTNRNESTASFRIEASKFGPDSRFSNCWIDRDLSFFQIVKRGDPTNILYEYRTETAACQLVNLEPNRGSNSVIDVSQNRRVIAAAWGPTCILYDYDRTKIAEFNVGRGDGGIGALSFSRSGRKLALCCETGTVKVLLLPD